MSSRYCIVHRNIDCQALPIKGELKTNSDRLIDELKASSDTIIVSASINVELAKLRWSQSLVVNFDSFAIDGRLYFLWDRFTGWGLNYLGERSCGGFDYRIFNRNHACNLHTTNALNIQKNFYLPHKKVSLILQSEEFKSLARWLEEHQTDWFIDSRMPFPELSQFFPKCHARLTHYPELIAGMSPMIAFEIDLKCV